MLHRQYFKQGLFHTHHPHGHVCPLSAQLSKVLGECVLHKNTTTQRGVTVICKANKGSHLSPDAADAKSVHQCESLMLTDVLHY